MAALNFKQPVLNIARWGNGLVRLLPAEGGYKILVVKGVLKNHRPGDHIAHTPNDVHEDVTTCRGSESRAPPIRVV